ncbi:FAD binding domain-containing protein [Sabulicella glaciei]|uniref:FAD binding domain-containing protein n=1 Tax=Sabulicella glaciei TaxID=2984948 RepID=A0ABT3NQM4_9PROT|nr:FAD binding domain-containing protein [Roseococcus sp. MDT2-1-1]MCW8084457.1 FAD binding domain-containing protein [Roseococcus sp. MDT2-1-1]
MASIEITLNGARRTTEAPPTTTLLDWLRTEGLTGAKEGCAEGDCGACTVVIEAGASRRPINACLCVLGQVHGRAIRTIEGLGRDHPAVRAMAEGGATQCGFCTPGIVMAAWAWTRTGGDPHAALAGNLCRCTGYRPILEAMAAMRDDGGSAPGYAAAPSRFGSFHLPATLEEAVVLRAARPGAMLLAGGTDLGLRFSEDREHPEETVCLLHVREMQGVKTGAAGQRIGAAAPYAEWLEACREDARFTPLVPYLERLGSRQIRSLGTVGGNLGTASPIGDALPVLLALDAVVECTSPRGTRRVPVEEFLLGYRRNALAADELIVAVELPAPPPGALLAAEKLSRRHDQDISAVSLVACIEFAGGTTSRARLALGGMAARAMRAHEAEVVLVGRALDDAAAREAGEALRFAPMDDHRGTAAYRMEAARGLLRRLALRHARPDLPATIHA